MNHSTPKSSQSEVSVEDKCPPSTKCSIIGFISRLFIILVLSFWLVSAVYLYQQDLEENVGQVEGLITVRYTFRRNYIYSVHYEFQPREYPDDRKFKGVFHVEVTSQSRANEYNAIYSYGSHIPVYYRKHNPQENDITRSGLYDEGLLANVILSAIAAGIGIPILLCISICKVSDDKGTEDELSDRNDCICCYSPGGNSTVCNRRWKNWILGAT